VTGAEIEPRHRESRNGEHKSNGNAEPLVRNRRDAFCRQYKSHRQDQRGSKDVHDDVGDLLIHG